MRTEGPLDGLAVRKIGVETAAVVGYALVDVLLR